MKKNEPASESMIELINLVAKEKGITADVLFDAIENSLLTACKQHFGTNENMHVEISHETGEYHVFIDKTVVETKDDVMDDVLEIDLDNAKKYVKDAQVGDTVSEEIKSKDFSRIAAQNAKNVLLQKMREEERNVVFNQYYEKEREVVTGTIQRVNNNGTISINLGKCDAILNTSEMVPNERYIPGRRLKVYVVEVKNGNKGPRVMVSRTHPELVKRLFEEEVSEIRDGVVEIVNVAREAGSRTKMSVRSLNENVDPVGACVGQRSSRVDAIVTELNGEKIDIVNWDENPGNYIQNALSPAKIVAVFADPDEKDAKVVVPDNQLSLAIGREGQNARLAAKLTGYKIDIRDETTAKDTVGFRMEDYMYDEEDYEYDEEAEGDFEEVEEDPKNE